eukprot:EST44002.1 Hypothetical protein SS50377_16311 [Spironucleus salmonicida]
MNYEALLQPPHERVIKVQTQNKITPRFYTPKPEQKYTFLIQLPKLHKFNIKCQQINETINKSERFPQTTLKQPLFKHQTQPLPSKNLIPDYFFSDSE